MRLLEAPLQDFCSLVPTVLGHNALKNEEVDQIKSGGSKAKLIE